MSFASEEEVDCPCGETFTAQLWNSINLKEDPDLRSILIGGELNVNPCPMCKSLTYTERFVLIHDPVNELMVFMHPKAREAEREFLETAMKKDFAEAQDVPGSPRIPYPPELHFGLETVVEVIRREEESVIQSTILDALAPGIPVQAVHLGAAKARAAGLPRTVPLAGTGDVKTRLLNGLKAALAANDQLTVYQGLLAEVEAGRVPDKTFAALPA